MAWVSTRGNARNAHVHLRTIRRRSITRFGGGTSACHITKNGMASRPLRLEGAAAPAGLALVTHTTWPRASPGATRSGVALGPVPSRPLILDPRPLAPWKAGSVGRARDPNR